MRTGECSRRPHFAARTRRDGSNQAKAHDRSRSDSRHFAHHGSSSADVALRVNSSSSNSLNLKRNVETDVVSLSRNGRLSGVARTQGVCVTIGGLVQYGAIGPQPVAPFVVISSFTTSLIVGVMGVTTYGNADYWSLSP